MKMLLRARLLACLMLSSLQMSRVACGDEAPPLPIERVVLFTSGVAYFDHGGEVEDDRSIALKFKVGDINDLLKSMVLQDFGGGKISTVTYESQDPIARTLQTFAIDLTNNPTVADLLRQLRGQSIEVDTPKPVRGHVVGVEVRRIPAGEQVVESETLILKTETGVRTIPLAQVVELRLLDQRLNDDFQKALALLAGVRDSQQKSVTLDFRGKGKRPVRVGYVQEFPVWKTSYRLVLSDDKPPFLQGWAIVENVTDHDWRDVQMTLVSGRPISFVMDLYQPLYQSRPTVMPEQYAGLQPRVHSQNLYGAEATPLIVGTFNGKPVRGGTMYSGDPFGSAGGGFGGGAGGLGGGGFGGSIGGSIGGSVSGMARAEEAGPAKRPLNLKEGVAASALGEDAGELFRYVIDSPVTLLRQKSALLPIVNQSIEGAKVAVFNRQTHVKHPLDGFRLKNATKLHLMQGPITVFDADQYAGDARIADVPPDAERLITYALDLKTEITVEERTAPSALVAVRIDSGLIKAREKQIRSTAYLVKSSGAEKEILLEQPSDAGWELVSPEKPTERTRDLYRFAVKALPEKTVKLTVEEQKLTEVDHIIGQIDDRSLAKLIGGDAASPAVQKVYQQILSLRRSMAEATQARVALEKQLSAIEEDQTRIRANMDRLDRQSELYRSYVKKLTDQEENIVSLRESIRKAQEKEKSADTDLLAYMATATAK